MHFAKLRAAYAREGGARGPSDQEIDGMFGFLMTQGLNQLNGISARYVPGVQVELTSTMEIRGECRRRVSIQLDSSDAHASRGNEAEGHSAAAGEEVEHTRAATAT